VKSKNNQDTLSNRQRDDALDFVKGFLVEIMVVYHVLNYCFSIRHPALIYIDFVTGSFVFITGYIASSIYVTKYNDNSKKIVTRLAVRGFKLLSLFLIINFIVYCLSLKNYDGYEFTIENFWKNIGVILFRGSAEVSVFELLVPIAYTLILSSIMMRLLKKRTLITAVVIPFVGISTVLKQDNYFNMYFVSIGLAGLVAGYFAQYIQNYRGVIWTKLLSSGGIIAYCIIITIFGRDNLILYILGIMSVLFVVYSLPIDIFKVTSICKWVIFLGKYSLVCYLAQILFLQLIHHLFTNQMITISSAFIFFMATNIGLSILCNLIQSLRNYNGGINRIYLAVFG
jgi:peptidoglycan/LPS O-acetylase OafA/YrhL